MVLKVLALAFGYETRIFNLCLSFTTVLFRLSFLFNNNKNSAWPSPKWSLYQCKKKKKESFLMPIPFAHIFLVIMRIPRLLSNFSQILIQHFPRILAFKVLFSPVSSFLFCIRAILVSTSDAVIINYS